MEPTKKEYVVYTPSTYILQDFFLIEKKFPSSIIIILYILMGLKKHTFQANFQDMNIHIYTYIYVYINNNLNTLLIYLFARHTHIFKYSGFEYVSYRQTIYIEYRIDYEMNSWTAPILYAFTPNYIIYCTYTYNIIHTYICMQYIQRKVSNLCLLIYLFML